MTDLLKKTAMRRRVSMAIKGVVTVIVLALLAFLLR